MQIDTRYRQGQMIVMMTLHTPEERALPDDLLARIGDNQHELDWHEGTSGQAELPSIDPAVFPLRHTEYQLTRSPGHRDGVELVRLAYQIPSRVTARPANAPERRISQ